ncbi:MAG: aminoacyl-tRNA hydrolase [Caldilineaceae bacterium]|nr:aminoacyl-tRNA hydrolase [Caldilineaceae bacterium]
MLQISRAITIPDNDITIEAIRAQGAGGQHVNKSSTAIQLRYDVVNGSLPEPVKERLLRRPDRRMTKDGVLIIKAQQHRSQERNRAEALERLAEIIRAAIPAPVRRRPTRPSRGSVERRIMAKKQHSQKKAQRKAPRDWA